MKNNKEEIPQFPFVWLPKNHADVWEGRAAPIQDDRESTARKEDFESFWESLTDEERLSLSKRCCSGCGSLNILCQCNNDE